MSTHIRSNGSKFYGDIPDDLEMLFERLATETLSPRFEPYVRPDESKAGRFVYFGNFATTSAGFTLYTDDADIIEAMNRLIAENVSTPAWKEERDELIADEARAAARIASGDVFGRRG